MVRVNEPKITCIGEKRQKWLKISNKTLTNFIFFEVPQRGMAKGEVVVVRDRDQDQHR